MTAPSRPAQVSPSTTVEEAEKPMEAAKPEEMSIYGEVKSTDSAANSVKLRYYDYDSDEEKTEEIILDRSTKMENAAGLQDIKEGDWIDAVYVPKGGKNIAKSVIVEKEEEEPADVAGTKPEGKSAETPPMME
jgi:Cu/Ag efflux protein CusF